MKCLYYLAPSLDETYKISHDLHDAGVHDWFLHVVSKDEAGLQQVSLRSSNYFETLDLVRDGVIGAVAGALLGMLGVGLLIYFEPFGAAVPWFVYAGLVVLATLFGAWEGGLFGVDTHNRKIADFRADIDAGKYLVLIYTRKGQGQIVKEMMAQKYPAAIHVATDRHFINPFATPEIKHARHSQRWSAASK